VTPHYADDWLTVYGGDCRTVLTELPAESVDCIVTSPPYWGLRDYGTATWIGGDELHEHRGSVARTAPPGTCKCGATRIDDQLGLESTPEAYVANMVAVFREVRRVLRSDGTAWLNLGDSYASSPPGNTTVGVSGASTLHGVNGESGRYRETLAAGTQTKRNTVVGGLKPKDLVGIPWRVAFALQADGWYLRSDIIWAKPNPMPESVTDRPTKAHEYLFLLSKSARYYFDQEAVREAVATSTYQRLDQDVAHQNGSTRQPGKTNGPMRAVGDASGRNLRSVWNIATRPYAGAHFAVFPPELPERCIKAGCPPEGKRCDCDVPILTPLGSGASDDPTLQNGRAGMNRPRRPNEGTRPITRREQRDHARQLRDSQHRDEMEAEAGAAFAHYLRTDESGARPIPPDLLTNWTERGWLSDPAPCPHPVKPAGVVLDPFAGSGTVGLVANRLSRRAILIDLNPAYLEQQMKRNAQVPVGL
jgi:DNA modification methylase